MRLSRLNLWSGLAAVSVPVGYLIYQHVSWEKTRAGKQAMLTHQLTFWGTVVAGITLLHESFRLRRDQTPKVIGFRIAAALLPVLGFWGGERLSEWGFSAQKQLEKQQLHHPNQYQPPFLRQTENGSPRRPAPNTLYHSA